MEGCVSGIGHQMLAWALGLTVMLALLDSRQGFLRDHPPRGWRSAGMLVGPLTGTAVLLLLASCCKWSVLLLIGPFVVMSGWYSLAWAARWKASDRRWVGTRAAVVGVLALLFVMLTGGPERWACSVVMGAYASSAALLGGFTLLWLGALGEGADSVGESFSPYGLLARMVALGLTMAGLTALDLFRLREEIPGGFGTLGLWLTLSLALPLLLVAIGHRIYPRGQRWIWAAAWCCTLVGQATIHTMMMSAPGLVPPLSPIP